MDADLCGAPTRKGPPCRATRAWCAWHSGPRALSPEDAKRRQAPLRAANERRRAEHRARLAAVAALEAQVRAAEERSRELRRAKVVPQTRRDRW